MLLFTIRLTALGNVVWAEYLDSSLREGLKSPSLFSCFMGENDFLLTDWLFSDFVPDRWWLDWRLEENSLDITLCSVIGFKAPVIFTFLLTLIILGNEHNLPEISNIDIKVVVLTIGHSLELEQPVGEYESVHQGVASDSVGCVSRDISVIQTYCWSPCSVSGRPWCEAGPAVRYTLLALGTPSESCLIGSRSVCSVASACCPWLSFLNL